jgi:hypothetical protein
MKLNIEKLNGFNLATQMTIGRAAERYATLTAKPSRTADENKQLEALNSQLAPFDLDATQTTREPTTLPRDSKEARIADHNRGVILNARKIENLSGAKRLELHRKSAALGRLIEKPADFLTPAEREQLAKLRDDVRPYVGLEGSIATDADFKRAAA